MEAPPSPPQRWRWPWIGIGVLLGAGLLGQAGGIFTPLELLSHFQVYFAGGWLLLLPLLWAARRRLLRPRLVLLAGLAGLALHGGLVGALFWRASRTPLSEAETIELVWANIWRESPDHRPLYRWLPACGADLIGLGEVLPAVLKDLDHLLESSHPYRRRVPGTGLALYSRLPLEGLEEVILGEERPAMWTTVQTAAGRRLTVLLAHVDHHGSGLRQAALEQLAALCRNRERVILAGDLNTTNWSPFFRELLAAGGLRDSRQGRGVLASWRWSVFGLLRLPIDHVLTGGAVEVTELEVGPEIGSDHRPLQARLTLGAEWATTR